MIPNYTNTKTELVFTAIAHFCTTNVKIQVLDKVKFNEWLENNEEPQWSDLRCWSYVNPGVITFEYGEIRSGEIDDNGTLVEALYDEAFVLDEE
jgi:hypothetical protein